MLFKTKQAEKTLGVFDISFSQQSKKKEKKEQCKKNEKSLQSTPANADSAEIEYT